MSYDFNGTTQSLTNSVPLIPSPNATVFAWFKPTSLLGTHVICADGNTGSAQYDVLYTSGSFLAVNRKDATIDNGVTTLNLVNLLAWNTAVLRLDANLQVILNADFANKGSTLSTSTPSLNIFDVGVFHNNALTPSLFFSGSIAHVAIYNQALTDTEITSLNAGYSPLLIRPQALTHYWPLTNGTQDLINQSNLTPVLAPVLSADPSITYPTHSQPIPTPIPPIPDFTTFDQRNAMIGSITVPTLSSQITTTKDRLQQLDLPRYGIQTFIPPNNPQDEQSLNLSIGNKL